MHDVREPINVAILAASEEKILMVSVRLGLGNVVGKCIEDQSMVSVTKIVAVIDSAIGARQNERYNRAPSA